MFRETKKAPPMRQPYQEIAKAENALEALRVAEQVKALQRQNRKLSDDDARRHLKAEQYRMNMDRRAAAEQAQAERLAQERREYDKDRLIEELLLLKSAKPEAAPVGLEQRLGSAQLNRLIRGEQEMNQRINAELVMRELQLEGMVEPLLKEMQAQGTPVTKETKVRLIQRLGKMLGQDLEKQIGRANTGVQDYVKNQGVLRLAGQGLLAAGLGLGAYEYMDPEDVVEDPATSRQLQGTLN